MEKQQYMLDTNTASYIIKGKPVAVGEHLRNVPMTSIIISAITEAELLRGVAGKPGAIHLPTVVNEFLLRVEIVPWDSEAAKAYAKLRTASEFEGISLGAMDMLIAAHSVAVGAILITNDQSFYNLNKYLNLQDWKKTS